LKAGGAYVPLDPGYPIERLAYVLNNCQPGVILTQGHLRGLFSQFPGEILGLDHEWEDRIAAASSASPMRNMHRENLVYQIYTSGSTGLPKGVQISHGALENFVLSMIEELEVSAQETLVAVTSLSFDIAGLELYVPLVQGARLVIGSQGIAGRGDDLARLLEIMGATIMQATPSGWRVLINSGWTGNEHLLLLCGGEAFPQDLTQRLLSSGRALWNMYGPTETTIWSALQQVQSQGSMVPLGHPVANTQIYLLDRAGMPVPIGVIGEVFIGGEDWRVGTVDEQISRGSVLYPIHSPRK